MANKFYDIMFTDGVKAAQDHYGSRRNYERIQSGKYTGTLLSDAEEAFIEECDGFYMATVGEQGQPYIQFRGGPKGFLKVIDERTLGFADFRGNLQYISVGNLRTNAQAALFLMDHANQRRLKIIARAEVLDAEESPEVTAKLRMPGYEAKIERAVTFHVDAFDWNCPQHITPRYTAEEVRAMVQPINDHVAKLERELAELKEAR